MLHPSIHASSRWFLLLFLVVMITGRVVVVVGMKETDVDSWLRGHMDGGLPRTETKNQQHGTTTSSFVMHYKPLNVGNKNRRSKQHQRRRARVAGAAAAPITRGDTGAVDSPALPQQPRRIKSKSKSSKKPSSKKGAPKGHHDIFAKTKGKGIVISTSKSKSSKKKASSSKKEEPKSPKPKKSSSGSSSSYSKGKGKGYYRGKGKGGRPPKPGPTKFSWQLIPPIITGDAVGDEAGRSVSYSRDGTIMAIGLPGSRLANATSTGLVRVYRLDQKSKSWVQFGQDIVQPQSDRDTPSRFGHAIDLDHRGYQIVISAPGYFDNRGIVYSFLYFDETNRWDAYGGIVIAGTDIGEELGSSIAMSGLGDVVVVGAPKKSRANSGDVNAGQVAVRYLDLAAFEWRRFGRQEFTGATAGDECGTAVSLSTDGFVFAFGCPGSDRTLQNAGTVVAFETTDGLGDNSNWKLYGEPISGVAAGEQCGVTLDLSELGDIIAYGCPQNDASFVGSTAGVVRLVEFEHYDSWQRMGKDIEGDGKNGAIGSSLALSGIGNVVAYYQSPLLDDGEGIVNTQQSDVLFDGHVTVLFYNGAQFVQVGQTIEIDGLERFPFALDLTHDGLSIIIGAVGFRDPGRIQAFRLVTGQTPSPTPAGNTDSPSTSRTNSPTLSPESSAPTTKRPSQESVAPATKPPTSTSRTNSPTLSPVSSAPTTSQESVAPATKPPTLTSSPTRTFFPTGFTVDPTTTFGPSITNPPSLFPTPPA